MPKFLHGIVKIEEKVSGNKGRTHGKIEILGEFGIFRNAQCRNRDKIHVRIGNTGTLVNSINLTGRKT